MGISFRRARAGDVGAIACLAEELGYPSPSAEVARRLEGLLARPEHAVLVGVESGGRVVGWVHVLALDSLVHERFALIAGLVVDEKARGSGIGAGLVGEAEAWARDQELDLVRVRSRESRADAHRFYASLGYEEEKTQKLFRRRLG